MSKIGRHLQTPEVLYRPCTGIVGVPFGDYIGAILRRFLGPRSSALNGCHPLDCLNDWTLLISRMDFVLCSKLEALESMGLGFKGFANFGTKCSNVHDSLVPGILCFGYLDP